MSIGSRKTGEVRNRDRFAVELGEANLYLRETEYYYKLK